MAKRKRLMPAQADYMAPPVPGDTQVVLPSEQRMGARAPIAQVAGDSATASALSELAREMSTARAQGRFVQVIPHELVDEDYLVRDRIRADEEELDVLMQSLRRRGQQTPIEVVELPTGRYGLISGWRRLAALRQLLHHTGETRFSTALAMLRRPETAADAYVAMVEENEIRSGLSYYERARVAAKAVEQGVYENEKAALLALFVSVSRAKRSKIRSFLPIYHALDDALLFPAAIPERLGLALSKRLVADPELGARLAERMKQAPLRTAEHELALLALADGIERSDQKVVPREEPSPRKSTTAAQPVVKAKIQMRSRLHHGAHTVTLSGDGVTDDFLRALQDWLKNQDALS